MICAGPPGGEVTVATQEDRQWTCLAVVGQEYRGLLWMTASDQGYRESMSTIFVDQEGKRSSGWSEL